VREQATMARQGRGTGGGAPRRYRHNGRRRLGIDMAGGGGEQIGVGTRDGSGGGSGAATGGLQGGMWLWWQDGE
jgi:hypothetical protein